ncbi:MAG: IclR family transcriptional regulator [Actinomycetota bacterium]|nr:IclR family transcriptional regulator [Actinomycetota bacterium]
MSTVQSIERAFALLKVLSGGPAGVTDLADRVGLPKSTVSRLLSTLEELGVVEQPAAGGVYRIGAGMIELAAAASPGRSLISTARPHLIELNRRTGEASGISIPDGFDMFYLDQVTPNAELQVRDWTGTRIPMHAVPSGQALLALDDALLDQYLAAPLQRFTQHTLTSATALRKRITEVRRAGYAWAMEEYAEGMNSVAAALRTQDGRVVAALHVYGPASRFPGERDAHEIGEMVKATAAKIKFD